MCWIIVVYFWCFHRWNFEDYMLCYVIYVVIYWMEFLPSYYYYGKKNLRMYDLIWSILFFYIDLSDTCRWFLNIVWFESYYYFVSYYYYHLIFFYFFIPDETFFISVIIRFYSRITKIGKFLIICYIFIDLNQSGSYYSNFFSYDFFFFIFSTGGGM